ncbi:hypothetical protein FACS1894163_11710 [Spirochaetia bacterium]|nr:hypothetical protein FACS1894163_11710 [Spirochaetia bacterium]
MEKGLDNGNLKPAYVCGQIFAVLVDIQKAAFGKDLNAGIRERFFSFTATTPAAAFGRLMRLSQNHLTKIKTEKPKLSGYFDKRLQEICAKIDGHTFPAQLTLEEQGQFALGYYHKKQEGWENAKTNAELKKVLEDTKEDENGDKK